MSEKATGRESDKFMLRLPDGMRERIAKVAKANNRSMNAEIVYVLEAHFPPDPDPDIVLDHIELLLATIKRSNLGTDRAHLVNLIDDYLILTGSKPD